VLGGHGLGSCGSKFHPLVSSCECSSEASGFIEGYLSNYYILHNGGAVFCHRTFCASSSLVMFLIYIFIRVFTFSQFFLYHNCQCFLIVFIRVQSAVCLIDLVLGYVPIIISYDKAGAVCGIIWPSTQQSQNK
jgi:hypothetical protein